MRVNICRAAIPFKNSAYNKKLIFDGIIDFLSKAIVYCHNFVFFRRKYKKYQFHPFYLKQIKRVKGFLHDRPKERQIRP